MPITQTQVTASQCFQTARMLLNDANMQLWQDAVLMPMMYQAHLELQQKLKSRAAPIMKGITNFPVPAYSTGTTVWDMTSPIQMWEKPQGAPDQNYQPMTEIDVIPTMVDRTTTLRYWSWFQEYISFLGATIATNVLVVYWRRLPVPTSSGDQIGIIDGEQYLAPRIAALAMGSVGEEQTISVATALAEAQLQFVLSANKSRAGQVIGTSVHP